MIPLNSSLQESFRKFQHLIDTCSKYNSTALDKMQCSLKHPYLASLPKPTMNAYSTVCQLQLQTTQSLGNIMVNTSIFSILNFKGLTVDQVITWKPLLSFSPGAPPGASTGLQESV